MEQSQKCVKNMNPVTIEQGGPVVRRQSSASFVPSVIKTNIPLTDDPAQEEDLLHRKRTN